MSRTASKDRILACRLTDEEERAVDAMARAAGVSPARFLRNVVIEKVQSANGKPEPVRSWGDELDKLREVLPGEAMERFNELRAGRQLPKGFALMPRAEQVTWLDREWPL
jgi:hypothetical protein